MDDDVLTKTEGNDGASFAKREPMESVELDLKCKSLFRGWNVMGEEGPLGVTSGESGRSRVRLCSASGAVDGRPERPEGEEGPGEEG